MSEVSTHVLDLERGRPAAGVPVRLDRWTTRSGWQALGESVTDREGRASGLARDLEPGRYRLSFETGRYFGEREVPTFYPVVEVVFAVEAEGERYHVPLLLSPFGYSTYRGS